MFPKWIWITLVIFSYVLYMDLRITLVIIGQLENAENGNESGNGNGNGNHHNYLPFLIFYLDWRARIHNN